MAENTQVITYEKIYEMLRAEKNSAKLQSISPSFYQDCFTYFNEKKNSLNNTTNKFAKKDTILIQRQIENIRSLLENLHSLRMKKVVLLAQDKAKIETITVDKTPMFEEEKELFENILKLILEHKDKTLNRVFDEMEIKTPEKEIFDDTKKFTDLENKKNDQQEIKFTQPVAKFFDAEMNSYGPYDKGDITKLPSNVVKILLSKGAAEIIN